MVKSNMEWQPAISSADILQKHNTKKAAHEQLSQALGKMEGMTEWRSNKGSPVNFLLVLSLPDGMLGNLVIALPSSHLGCSR